MASGPTERRGIALMRDTMPLRISLLCVFLFRLSILPTICFEVCCLLNTRRRALVEGIKIDFIRTWEKTTLPGRGTR